MPGLEAVQTYCGWHIAPSISETVFIESDGGRALLLPSLYVTDVTEVRDESGRVVTGWKWRPNGVIRGNWRVDERYAVDIVHGYDFLPEELQDVITKMNEDGIGAGALRSVTRGPFSESYDPSGQFVAVRTILDRYRLQP